MLVVCETICAWNMDKINKNYRLQLYFEDDQPFPDNEKI